MKYSILKRFCDNVSKVTTNEILGAVKSFAHTQHVTASYGGLTARASAVFDWNLWCGSHGLD